MILQQLVNGIMLGSIYALLGVAFTLIIGTLGLLNIAVGEVFMLGAFFGLAALRVGVPFPLALLAATVGAGGINLLIERVAFRPLRRAGVLVPFLSSIGCALFLQNTAANIWGSEPTRFPVSFGETSLHLGDVLVSPSHLITLGTAVSLALGVNFFIWRTRLGRGLRAVAADRDVANLLGVEPDLVIPLTFFISGVLAGAAGVLVGVAVSSVSTQMGLDTALKGVAAMVLGGVGNLRGALIGGILLGVAEVLSVALVGASFREMIVFGPLLVVLFVRPAGLFGASQRADWS